MINIEINGQPLSLENEMTILEAARKLGIHIPTLCYHEQLRPLGHCRICLVEVEGLARPVTACNTPVIDGMVINTNTPRVKELRREVLALLLSTHPIEKCLVCEKAGNCDLQSCAYSFGLGSREIQPLDGQPVIPVDDNNPYIVRDMQKCILCGRCVAVCAQVQGILALRLAGTGINVKAAPMQGGREVALPETTCNFCGQCVDVCPVGALTEKERARKGREWELHGVPAICPSCSLGCAITIESKNGRPVRVTGRGGASNGVLCKKGKFGLLAARPRVTTPLIRVGGRFQSATWEEALARISAAFAEVKQNSGPEALAVWGAADSTNEELYQLQKLARVVLGTNNIDHFDPQFVRGTASLLVNNMYASPATVDEADCLLIIGDQLTRSFPVLAARVKAAVRFRGAKLILLGDDEEMAAYADIRLACHAGHETALVNGVLAVIITEQLYNQKVAKQHAEGFAKLQEVLAAYTPAAVAEATGIDKRTLLEAAHTYAACLRPVLLYAPDSSAGSRALWEALSNLSLAMGYSAGEEWGLNLLRSCANSQGAIDMGVTPSLLPGHRRAAEAWTKKLFAAQWHVALPENDGLTIDDLAVSPGRIKAAYLAGDDIDVDQPGAAAFKRLLEQTDFLVVQETTMSPAARLADIVLPSAALLEKEGTFTNTAGLLQLSSRAVAPPEGVRDGCRIIADLAAAMGRPFPAAPEDILAEISMLVDYYQGAAYATLKENALPCTLPATPEIDFFVPA